MRPILGLSGAIYARRRVAVDAEFWASEDPNLAAAWGGRTYGRLVLESIVENEVDVGGRGNPVTIVLVAISEWTEVDESGGARRGRGPEEGV